MTRLMADITGVLRETYTTFWTFEPAEGWTIGAWIIGRRMIVVLAGSLGKLLFWLALWLSDESSAETSTSPVLGRFILQNLWVCAVRTEVRVRACSEAGGHLNVG